jgi:uncharacterized protein
MTKPRIVYVHGNGTLHWSYGWASWFKFEVEKLGFETFFETMPDSIIARGEYWLPFLQDHVGVGENDVLVGWSSGAVAAMRYAETHKLHGSVLISPSYTDLNDELERESGYYANPWLWDDIKKNQQHIAVIHGDNDPWIPQEQFTFIAGKLGAEQMTVPGAQHFIELTQFPALMDYFKRTYAVGV